MSKKRSQRNTKKYLKSLKAKRQKFYYGGYGGAPASSAPINYGENRAAKIESAAVVWVTTCFEQRSDR